MATEPSNISGIFKKISIAPFSPKRLTLIMLIALTLLGGMGWIMISEKEEYLVQRNFRLLKLWSQDIASKIESSRKVFEFSAKGILGALHFDSKFKQKSENERIRRFLRTYNPPSNKHGDHSKENQTHKELLKKVSPWPCSQKEGATPIADLALKQQKIIQDLERHLIGMCEVEGLTTVTLSIPNQNPMETETETETNTEKFKLSVAQYQNPPIIRLTMNLDDRKENIQISGEITLGHFLHTLTNDPIFDETLLFESVESVKEKGKNQPLIFHSGSQEFSWTDFQQIIDRSSPITSFWENLLGNSQDSSQLGDESFIQHNSPHHFLIDVPGKTINVFTLPVILPQYKRLDWRLVGMIDHDTFQNSYLAISSTLLLGVMFLILGLVLAIPLLHLKTTGATDPLRITHVLTVILAAFLGTGLFTILIMDIAIYGEGKTTLHQRMESSAEAIKENLDQELKSILFTLDQFDQSGALQKDIDELNKKPEKRNVGERSVLLEVLEDQENPEDQMKRLCPFQKQHCYSNFLSAFWMDQDGTLRIDWAKKHSQGVTTNLDLLGREYVKRVLKKPENLWQISDRTKSQTYEFFLEPIISWTTGLNTVVASMSSHGTNQQPNGWVAAMEFTFLSLMDHVVLPPGIGFAVIDSDHDVLFHSKERRNLREAFLVETDHNPKLRDLFAAKTAGHANGSYRGKSTSFYTLPLDPLPWALVVFRDREILRSVNLFGLLVTGSLYGLWSILVYGIAWYLLRKTPGPRKAIWMWPNLEYQHHYDNLIKSNMVMFVVGLLVIWLLSGQPGWQLLTGLIFIPVSCLLSAIFLVKKYPSPHKVSLFTSPNSYAYLASSFLLIFAIIPALSCFTSVFHKEMTLLTQYQILETFKTFQDSGKEQTWASKNISFPPGCGASSTQINEASQDKAYGFYPDFFLETTWNICDNRGETATHKLEMFDQLFALVSQPFLPLLKNVPLWGFLGESWPDPSSNTTEHTNQKPIHWGKDKGRITMSFKDDPIQVSAPLPLRPWFLTGNGPNLSSLTFAKLPMQAFMLALVILLIIWLFKIPKFIATRTVFLGYPIPRQTTINTLFSPTGQTPPSINQLILGFPGQGKTFMAYQSHKDQETHQNNRNTHALYFDLKTLPPEQWKETLSNDIVNLNLQDQHSLHITVDHLELQWKDPEINRQKLEFLEWLLHRSNQTTPAHGTPSTPDQEASPTFKLGDLMIQVLTKILSQKQP